MAEIQYRPVTRKRRTFSGAWRVWHGGDHLLLVTTHWWTETYQRFRLREIHGITVSQRPNDVPARAVIFVVVLIVAIAAIAASGTFGRVAWAVVFGPLLVVQAVDIARGRRARVLLRTAVSEIAVPSLTRMKDARRFVDEMGPLIRAAQADIQPLTAPPVPGAFSMPPPEVPDDELPLTTFYILCGAAFFAAGGSLIALAKSISGPLPTLLWTAGLLAAGCGIHAVMRMKNPLLRVIALVVTAIVLVDLAGTAWVTIEMIANRRARLAPPEWFVRFAWITNPVEMAVAAAGTAIALAGRKRRGSDKLKEPA